VEVASRNDFGFQRAGHGSGPYMMLVASMVRLARRDLADPELSVGAKAFLRGEPYKGIEPEIDLGLFADLLGYGGRWD